MKIQCIDCKHCTATENGFYCHRIKKYTMPFRSCFDKKTLEKQKKIDYYLTHYKTMKKTQIAKHFNWDMSHLNAFILQNFLPKRNDRTGEYEEYDINMGE